MLLIESFESNEENKIAEETKLNQKELQMKFLTGVSIESASYMENNDNIKMIQSK